MPTGHAKPRQSAIILAFGPTGVSENTTQVRLLTYDVLKPTGVGCLVANGPVMSENSLVRPWVLASMLG